METVGLQWEMMGNSGLQDSIKNWECQICVLYVSLGWEFVLKKQIVKEWRPDLFIIFPGKRVCVA